MADIICGNTENGNDLTKEQLKRAVEQFGMPGSPEQIGIDDYFEFECQQCGACCMHRNDIILNAFDIYNASKYLGIETRDFITNYTIRYLGANSKIPIIVLKSEEKNGFCPFLKFDYAGCGAFKCSINPAKPGACSSHPIGLMSSCDIADNGDVNSIKTSFIKVDQCPQSKTGKMQRVKDWMKGYLDHKDESLKAHEMSIVTNSIINWREFFLITGVFTVSAARHGVKKVGDDMMTQAFNVLASLLIEFGYANFDTDKDFCLQCDENSEILKTQFTELNDKLLPSMKEVFYETCGITIEDAMKQADKEDIDKVIARIGVKCTYQGMSMSEHDDSNNSKEEDDDGSSS